jgi:hypothetical protein
MKYNKARIWSRKGRESRMGTTGNERKTKIQEKETRGKSTRGKVK